MHEAGLAASVADALRRHGLDAGGPAVRLIVKGGHDNAAGFDDALRLHIAMELPAFDQRRMSIAHAPRDALCVACGAAFRGTNADDPCPDCGGPGLAPPTPESIELEWADRT